MFTDIEGSTALLKRLGRERYANVLHRHQEVIRAQLALHRGEEIDTQGDAFFVAFRSASDGVAAAVAIQRALAGEVWPNDGEIRVRVGIHSGEASASGERYVGFSVHRAARVGAAGHGGQVLLSDAARVLVEDDLPDGLSLRDLGRHQLKDVERPERIWQVVADGLATGFPVLKTRRSRRRDPRLVAAAGIVIVGSVVVGVVLSTRGGAPSATVAAPIGADSVGIFRSADGNPVGQATVGVSPSGVAADAKGIWVTSADSGTVSRIDPATGALQQTIPTGDGPAGVAIAGGAVWVANSLDGNVARIDPATYTRVQTVTVGSQPRAIVSGPVGLWVANTGDRTLMRIDPVSGRVRKTIALATGVDAIAEGLGFLWVASELSGTVERIDPTSDASETINVGRAPDAVAVGPGAVWVANNLDGTVSDIDPATNSVASVIHVDAGPVALAPSSDGRHVWVSNELAGTLTRIDTSSDVVRRTIRIANRPEGIALSSNKMYVAVRTSGAAHRGGTLTIAFPHRLDLPRPLALDFAEDGYANSYPAMGAGLANDGLVAYRRSGGGEGLFLAPDLAVALPAPSADGRTFTFRLRTGIRYSNGRLVRPTDFRRAMERTLALGGRDLPGSYFDGIVGAHACIRMPKECDLSRGITTTVDTVTFHLTGPDPAFLYKLALPNAYAEPADTPLHAHLPLPATGPYMYRAFDKKHNLIELVRNPRFRVWSAAARPDGYPDVIRLQWGLKTADAAVRAVERGRADLAGVDVHVSPSLRAELLLRHRGLLHSEPIIQVTYLALNTHISPFNDRRAREALSLALDRRKLATLSGADLGTPTCQLLPPNLAGYRRYCPYDRSGRAAGQYTGADPARARRLVSASHTRGGHVRVRDTDAQGSTPVTRYVVSVLRNLGYRVQLVFGDPTGGDQVAKVGWTIDFPDASSVLIPLVGCANAGANPFSFCNRRIDREMSRALALERNRPQAAARLWARTDRDLVDEAPVVPYFNQRSTDVVSSRVGNYVYSAKSYSALFDQLWVR